MDELMYGDLMGNSSMEPYWFYLHDLDIAY